MKIAVITGASSGMGKEFVRQIASHYGWLDEIWAIARRSEALEELGKEIGIKVRVIPMDITDPKSIGKLKEMLREYKPYVKYLVNAAGCGVHRSVEVTSAGDCAGMIRSELQGPDGDYQAFSAVYEAEEPYCHGGIRCRFYPPAGICRVRGHKSVCPQLFPGSFPGAARLHCGDDCLPGAGRYGISRAYRWKETHAFL